MLLHQSHESRSSGLSPSAIRKSILMLVDVACVLACIPLGFALASLFRLLILGSQTPIQIDSLLLHAVMFAVPVFSMLWFSWRLGHYTRFRPVWTEFQELLKMVGYIALIDITILFVSHNSFSRLWIGFYFVSLCCLLPIGRQVSRNWMVRNGLWLKSTFIVGTGINAMMTARALGSDRALGCRVDGHIDLSGEVATGEHIDRKPVFNRVPDTVLSKGQLDENPCIVFAFESLSELNRHRAIVNQYIATSVDVIVSPPVSGLPLYGAEILTVFRQESVLLKLQNNMNAKGTRVAKRLFDFLSSFVLIVVLSPIMLALYWLVSRDGNSAIFGHRRIGRDGVVFQCLKFRTMVVDAEEALREHLDGNPEAQREWDATQKLNDDPRITKTGLWLRKTSLDELPQLINVLRGEMSLVGPRPIVQAEMAHYGDKLPYYLSMTPGVTGLWQTSGRSDTSYGERVMLDVWYARNWSFWHDLVILLRTFPTLMNCSGAR